MLKPHVRPSVLLALFISSAGVAVADGISAARQHELLHLLKQDCGSCHGLTLRGGLGPALTPDALRNKAPEAMIATIRYGRPGTPMPPWANEISETEAQWLVENLYKGVE
jgi:cytochrome c55X